MVSQLPLTTNEEFEATVEAAKAAFPSWRSTPVTARQRIMLKLQELIRRDTVRNCSFSRVVKKTKVRSLPFLAWDSVDQIFELARIDCVG